MGVDRGVKRLNPDWEAYAHIEKAQRLPGYTVRQADGRLAGYALFQIAGAIHYKGWTCAVNDVIYVAPEHRGEVGAKLILFAERELAGRGVDEVLYHFKAAQDKPELMERTGYKPYECMYHKVLREA